MFCTHCGQSLATAENFCPSCGAKKIITAPSNASTVFELGSAFASTPSFSTATLTREEYDKKSSDNRKKGLIWLFGPWVVLVVTEVVWWLVRFFVYPSTVVSRYGSSFHPSGWQTFYVLNTLFGLLTSLTCIAILVGMVLGIYYLTKREEYQGMVFDPRSGSGERSVMPREIDTWNWGAAGLTWVWGAAYRVWLAFLVFLPLVGWVFWIYLGLKGNQLAWSSSKWESVEAFMKAQNKWKVVGIIFLILRFILPILFIFLIIMLPLMYGGDFE